VEGIMTLEQIRIVQTQLQTQYQTLITTQVTDEKLSLLHAQALELRGALQLLNQLVVMETATLAAPPGATGPGIS